MIFFTISFGIHIYETLTCFVVDVVQGVILNNVTMHNNVQAIQDQYRRDGYLFAKITDMDFGRDGVLTLKINEGKLEEGVQCFGWSEQKAG